MSRFSASSDAAHRYSDAHDSLSRAEDSEDEDTLTSDEELESAVRILPNEGQPSPLRAYVIRAIALLCACSLSIGSHYASYILGPLKSRLSREMGTNNTEFSLLISAFSLNSTWTPLVGGLLASRFGTTTTSILATGVIFLGQALLLFGNLTDNVRMMTFGMWVYGLGVSPLAVVQETIIVRFFKSHGLGVSLALGLVAGKGASFVSARTSYPLSERYGPHAPFYASTILTAISFFVNIIYVCVSKWLVRESGTELEASELREEAENTQICLSESEALKKVAKKRMVYLRDITKLGDVFWAYIGLNVLCGAIWAPFTHLAANIIEKRYDLTERDASIKGSYLLAGSVALYPVTGILVDRVKRHGFVMQLFTASSLLTLLCYAWLALPPSWTKSPMLAIVSFASGHGFSPLLLVVIVPRLVPAKYVSTTLGAHKALEQVGSTAFQTLAGVILDFTKKKEVALSQLTRGDNRRDIQLVLNAFLFLNVVQLIGILGLAWLDRRRRESASRRQSALLSEVPSEVAPEDDDERAMATAKGKERAAAVWRVDNMHSARECNRGESCCRASTSDEVQSVPLLRDHSRHSSHRESRYVIAPLSPTPQQPSHLRKSKASLRRGEVFATMSAMAIFFVWVLFLGTAYMKLRSKEERGSAGVPVK
ncbi:MFS general substrate transporter [Fomitopsis betulina]|nr:MFS general substrate transporter [Fomitopsis betulina]